MHQSIASSLAGWLARWLAQSWAQGACSMATASTPADGLIGGQDKHFQEASGLTACNVRTAEAKFGTSDSRLTRGLS